MYKRIYKKACEEIKGDRDAILNKAFERAAQPEKQPEKKKSPILKYSFVGTAAAAVIVAGAVIFNWDVFKMPLDDIVSEDSADAVVEESAEVGSESEDEVVMPEDETEETAQRVVVTEEPAAETETEARTAPKVWEATEEAAAENIIEETEDAETATEFVLSRGRSMTLETTDEEEALEENAGENMSNSRTSSSSSAGSSGGAGAKTEVVMIEDDEDYDYDDDYDDDFSGGTMMLTTGWSGVDYDVEALTYEEYINYLGFDVAGIELPEGMSFDLIEESVYEIYTDEAGEIADDAAMFSASGGEKSITIMATRMIALDEEFEAYENVAANVARNGDYAIYAVKNGAYITIEFDNVESEEIDAIVGQMAE
ncbi:MAG: hypothetical protein LUG52_07465 [Clostridia bacterium]|nr:hypothetical protein [Clostridia bacterium]